jgi:hypothetical protein
MDELELGPNGGLLYCMEYLVCSSLAVFLCVLSVPLFRRSTPTNGCKTCSTALEKTTTLCSIARGRRGQRAVVVVGFGLTLKFCPQIELYSHSPVLRSLAERMKLGGWR